MTTEPKLLAVEATDKEYKLLASYKPSEEEVYAYPIAAGNRVFVKDYDTVTLWTID
jgi:outer membrane protein assembly factor BamB